MIETITEKNLIFGEIYGEIGAAGSSLWSGAAEELGCVSCRRQEGSGKDGVIPGNRHAPYPEERMFTAVLTVGWLSHTHCVLLFLPPKQGPTIISKWPWQ